MNNIILLIGGNEGDSYKYISKTKVFIQQKIGNIIKESSLYESEPWGFEHTQNFINQVIEVETKLTPLQVLKNGQQIESTLGRKSKTKTGYEARAMDIDILFYNNIIMNEPDLIIPHPKLHERKFTLSPLSENWKNHIHPLLNKSVGQLMSECKDEGWVKKLDK